MFVLARKSEVKGVHTMTFINAAAALEYARWQSLPLEEEDWQKNILCEVAGVKLIETGVGVYLIEYWEGERRRTPLLYTWAAAEAEFVARVEEADRG